ncbi:hypothetical protein GOV08_02280 [Candidatus Woesearchaeota archaeon]|nr:hypothetical protein [Candidatus Woesearchaeota archaeon]
MTEPQGLLKRYNEITQESVQKGEREELLKNVKEFIKSILDDADRILLAQRGVIVFLKKKIKRINSLHDEIKSKLRRFEKEHKDEYEEIAKTVEEDFDEVMNPIRDALNFIIRLEKDLAFGRHQLITQTFQFDFQTGSQLGFFANRERDIDRDENKLMKDFQRHILDMRNPVKLERVKPEVKKSVQRFTETISNDMKLIKQQMKNLIVLLVKLEDAKETVLQQALEQLGKLGLDQEALNEIKENFHQLEANIRNEAKTEWEGSKADLKLVA